MNPAPAFVPGHIAPPRPRDGALLFVARGVEILIAEDASGARIPRGAELPALAAAAHYLGALDGVDCYAAALPEGEALPAGYRLVTARTLYAQLGEARFFVAGRALAVAEWDATHQFCGRCGVPMLSVDNERARRCPRCRTQFWPRIAPAVIVLVTRGDAMLLARGARFVEPIFSTVAGFVEAGESLEETVAREVREEVGVEIAAPRYFGSQPWPFGRSLMVGFFAEYTGGDLRVDGEEIAEAGWFTPDALPRISQRPSIARMLIDDFCERVRAGVRA